MLKADTRGNTRIIVVALVGVLLGFGGGSYWHYQATRLKDAPKGDEAAVHLSEGTRKVLQGLRAPVELRFYSLMGQNQVAGSLREFAARVDELLEGFEQAAGGKIKLTRHPVESSADLQAMTAEGIRAFNLDKGDACYLGVAVVQDVHKEVLPQLAPEWEPALEADLIRAILRVASAGHQAAQAATVTAAEKAASEAVQRALPNYASLSAEEGARVLRETALEEIKATVKEMQTRIGQAEERLRQALNGSSKAEQQAARAELLQLQAEQTEKLKEIAARLQEQTTALDQLKGVTRSATTRSRTNSSNRPTR